MVIRNQCHRQTLKYLKYWNSAETEKNLSYYRQVDVISKAFELFLLYNKCVEIVRVNLQIAVTLLSRYIRRFAYLGWYSGLFSNVYKMSSDFCTFASNCALAPATKHRLKSRGNTA